MNLNDTDETKINSKLPFLFREQNWYNVFSYNKKQPYVASLQMFSCQTKAHDFAREKGEHEE